MSITQRARLRWQVSKFAVHRPCRALPHASEEAAFGALTRPQLPCLGASVAPVATRDTRRRGAGAGPAPAPRRRGPARALGPRVRANRRAEHNEKIGRLRGGRTHLASKTDPQSYLEA